MKFFSDCSGHCSICVCGDCGCLAGHGDDDFIPASSEQIIARLNRGAYAYYRNIMINELERRGIKYA